jgi:bacterioferritin-associated ferredoxin
MKTQVARSADEVICPCSGTTRGRVQDMFEQGLDMDTISRRTGAISGCGGCEWDIQQLLDELVESRPQKGGS